MSKEEIEQKYLPFVNKSYYCDLDGGIVFTIKRFKQSKSVYVEIHKIDCNSDYHTTFMVDSSRSFEIREEGLYFQCCLCVQISTLQKTRMVHYFVKIHKKKKEYTTFREVCIDNINNILNQKDNE